MPQLNRKSCWFQLKGKENRKEEMGQGGFLQNVHIPVATVAWAWRQCRHAAVAAVLRLDAGPPPAWIRASPRPSALSSFPLSSPGLAPLEP